MPNADPPINLSKRIASALGRARTFGWMEAAWPRLVLAASVVAIFLSLSWFGLWPVLPDSVRFLAVGLLIAAMVASFVWLLRTPKPTHKAAIKRVETASNLSGQPLLALEDAPFDDRDPHAMALWRAHQSAMAQKVEKLTGGPPAPRTERFDPWALRAPVLLALVVAFFVAGPDRAGRVMEAFAPASSAPTVPIRVDLWATPPAYTGLPPRTLLSDAAFQSTGQSDPDRPGSNGVPSPATIPTQSRLTLLTSDGSALTAQLQPMDGSAPLALVADGDTGIGQPANLEITITNDAILVLTHDGQSLDVPLVVIPDAPPTIRFADAPEVTRAGALTLSYVAQDDYAIASAHGEVTAADEQHADARHLVEPPRIDLILPSNATDTPTQTTRDLSAHPWAGLEVDMTLVVSDGAGQEATSTTRTLMLPMRPFREPFARALVEQRRLLAVDRATKPRAITALEGLALAPEAFMDDDYATFLALTVTTQRLRLAQSDEQLLAVLDMLWQLALQVEDGDLSLAGERLREAEEALAQALEEGASSEELAQLMDELREAFREYMEALAQRMQQSDMARAPQDMQLQNLNPQAMQDMMDQIEDLAELGSADAARQMLEELRQQLDALRGAQPMQGQEPSQQQQELREAMQDLQAITRDQQRLLDETFPFSNEAQRPRVQPEQRFGQQDPNAQPQGQPQQGENQPESPGANQPQDDARSPDTLERLSQEQQALREQLQDLMDRLADLGLDPSALGEAGEPMDQAGEQLGEGSASNAVPEQGRALEALRQGAQDMAQQLQQAEGEGEGQGEASGQQPGPQQGTGQPRMLLGPAPGQRGFDPLGRPQRATQPDSGERVRIPEESDIQRARDILNEIQRRLGDQQRPQPELDYLDRLIDRF